MRAAAWLTAALAVFVAYHQAAGADRDAAQAWQEWRAERHARLAAPDGWLSLVGLFWLPEGRTRLGSDPASEFHLAVGSAPPRVGTFVRTGQQVRFEPAPGVTVRRQDGLGMDAELAADSGGRPSVLVAGPLTFYLIERDTRLGVRVKDEHAPARTAFAGLAYHPFDAAWRIEARFRPSPPGTTLAVPSVLGTITQESSPGVVEFDAGGRPWRLAALDGGDGALFIVFADRSNGRTTYGGGRFLSAPAPRAGRVVLDFNRAYNPPCAFTEYATCPLPPRENRLGIEVNAGEQRYGSH